MKPDIILIPTNPISNVWHAIGRTDRGRDWLLMSWGNDITNQNLPKLKRQADEAGLTVETDWSNVVTEKVDP